MLHYFIKRPSIIFLITSIILVAGVISALLLPMKLLPKINEPFIITNVVLGSELSLDEVEREVSFPLEQIARQSPAVKNIQVITQSKQVRLNILVSDRAKQSDVDQLRETLQTRVQAIPRTLDFYEVRQQTTNNITFMQLAIIPEDIDNEHIRRDIMYRVIPELELIPGVQSISHMLERYDSKYNLLVKEEHADNLPLVYELVEELQQTLASPIIGRSANQPIRTELAIANQDELRQLLLPSLKQVQEIVDIEEIIESNNFFYEVNGRDYYRVFINVTTTADEVRIAKDIREEMSKLQQGAKWEYIYIVDTSEFIGQAISEVLKNILIGATVAVFLLWIIFRSLKTMLVVAISIPVSVAMTLITMNIFDYSINIITLIGLGLGIGMIVDACIVILENIFKKIEEGIPRLEAVLVGTKEVVAPVVTSILTTVVVFIPIANIDGMVGAMGKQFSLTVMVALFASLLVSITLIPILSFYLVPTIKPSSLHQWVLRNYERLLNYLMDRKVWVILSFVLLLSSLILVVVMFIPKNYIPDVSERAYSIRYNLSDQVSYEEHRQLMQETAENIRNIPGVEHVFYSGQRSNPRRGQFYVLYLPVEEMLVSEAEVNSKIRRLVNTELPISTARFSAGESDTSGIVQVALTTSSMHTVRENFQQIIDEIEQINGITSLESTLTPSNHQEWLFQYNREALYSSGFTRAQIEQQLAYILNGTQFQMKLGNREKDVSLTFPSQYRRDIHSLLGLRVHKELPVTYVELIDVTQIPAEAQRIRQDGVYEIGLTMYYQNEDEAQVLQALEQLFTQYSGSSLELQFSGKQQEQSAAFRSLIIAAIISFAIIFVLLSFQFNKLRQPFIIVITLPFTMIGVALGFILTGRVFDVLAMIGVVMLIGIVVNNSIVLIDFVNKRRDEAESPRQAIISAAKARLRPIFTTTFTTVGGMIPMFIGGTYTSDFQTPVATALIFGLLFSTVVSLILLPIAYELIEGNRFKSVKKSKDVMLSSD